VILPQILKRVDSLTEQDAVKRESATGPPLKTKPLSDCFDRGFVLEQQKVSNAAVFIFF
jgi:hypothetical protein